MNMDALLKAEKTLRAQNSVVDKHVASLNGRLAKLRSRRARLETKKRTLDSGLRWELRQAESKEKEIDLVRRAMKAKREQISLLRTHAAERREAIHQMEIKLKSVRTERETLEEKYLHPILKEVLERNAKFLGPVPQHILNKTEEDIFPEVKHALEGARKVHSRLGQVSTLASLFSSLFLYALLLSIFYGMYRSTSLLRKKLSMARTLFGIDMLFSILWLCIFISIMILHHDPFELLRINHGGWGLVIQLLIISAMIGNVMLRCIMVTASPKKVCIAELFATVFLGQHYYQNIGLPIILEESIKTSLSTYVCYFLVYFTMGVHRARNSKRGQRPRRTKWLNSTLQKVWKLCKDSFRAKNSLEDELMMPYDHMLGNPIVASNFKGQSFKVL